MNHLIKDKYINIIESLTRDGYAIIELLDNKTVEKLLNIYAKHKDRMVFSNGIYMTTWMSGKNDKIILKHEIEENILPSCNNYFENYKLLNTTFIIKNKHKTSDFPVHQDWSFIDERLYPSINIWIALQDTNINNGGLYIVKGSHKLQNHIRGAGKLSFDFSKFRKQLAPFLTPISIKKGQAVLFYYSTLHGSPANSKSIPRLIVATSLIPKEAEIIINHYNIKENRLEQYLVDDDFIYEYENIKEESLSIPPKGKIINTIPNYQPHEFAFDEIKKVAIRNNENIFQRILNKFR